MPSGKRKLAASAPRNFTGSAAVVSNVSRFPIWLSCLAFIPCLAIVGTGLWATSVRVNRLVRGAGTIITSVAPLLIRPAEIGIVRRLFVHSGDEVHTGQILAQLDDGTQVAQLEQYRAEMLNNDLDIGSCPGEWCMNGAAS